MRFQKISGLYGLKHHKYWRYHWCGTSNKGRLRATQRFTDKKLSSPNFPCCSSHISDISNIWCFRPTRYFLKPHSIHYPHIPTNHSSTITYTDPPNPPKKSPTWPFPHYEPVFHGITWPSESCTAVQCLVPLGFALLHLTVQTSTWPPSSTQEVNSWPRSSAFEIIVTQCMALGWVKKQGVGRVDLNWRIRSSYWQYAWFAHLYVRQQKCQNSLLMQRSK